MIGVGTAQTLQSWPKDSNSFEQHKNLLAAYVHADGTSSKPMAVEDEEDEEYQPFFFGTGNSVTVSVDWDKNLIRFKNPELDQPLEIPVLAPIKNTNNLKLCVGLSYNDRVRLVPSLPQV